jgi:hypothetical protein
VCFTCLLHSAGGFAGLAIIPLAKIIAIEHFLAFLFGGKRWRAPRFAC